MSPSRPLALAAAIAGPLLAAAAAALGAPAAPDASARPPPASGEDTLSAPAPPEWPGGLRAAPAGPDDTLPEPPGAGAWNGPLAREIVRAVAEARRRHPYGDTALRSFRARAEGHTYFLFDPGPASSLLDAPGGTRLVRADQLALRIAWRAPGRSRQTIVGRRSRELLPTEIRYHGDHLRVLLENFDRTISLSRGTEIRNVPHPASRRGLSRYEYRLADSLEVRVAGDRRRLYRLQVRPRDPDRPAVVGEMYVDGDRPAVARLSFTFTPSSYGDPQLEHVAVDLESGLIDGRYWLPVRQTTELQRRTPWLDVPAGGTIRTRFRISDYRLNPDDPVRIAGSGGHLVSLPDSALARYDDWELELLEGPAPGASRPGAGEVDLEELRDRARRLVGRRTLSGLAPSRLHLPDASHALRVRRGEGVLVGAGVRHRGAGWQAAGWAGYPFGSRRPEARATLSAGREGPSLRACLRCLSDIGPFAASSGLGASASALFGGDDFRDPYFRSGVEAAWRVPLDGGTGPGEGGVLKLSSAWEEHASAARVPGPQSGPDARPVRPVREGRSVTIGAGLEVPVGHLAGAGWRADLAAEAASEWAGDFGYTRTLLRVEGRSPPPEQQAVAWRIRLAGGAAGGGVPAQRLFLLGGRGTVPGHPFRGWGGDRVLLGRVDVAADVAPPWLRARAGLSAGWAGLAGPGERAADRLGVEGSGGARASVGAGLGLFWDVLRVRADRGLGSGTWRLNVSVDPEFWPIL